MSPEKADSLLCDALIEAVGKPYADDFASALECAAHVVASALLCQIDVCDDATGWPVRDVSDFQKDAA